MERVTLKAMTIGYLLLLQSVFWSALCGMVCAGANADANDLSLASGNTWYVRPSGRDYGDVDGTSYEDAWSGLLNVIWGPGGVEAGDTLYVCGLHLYVMQTRHPPIYTVIVPVTGLSETRRVTIRGDYADDPGIVWGAAGVEYEDWTYEGDNVWSLRLPGRCYADWFFQDITARSWVVLRKEDSIEGVADNPGSHYYGGEREDRLYVHLTDSADPTGRVYINKFGYRFSLDDVRYVTFRSLRLLNVFGFCQPSWTVSDVEWNNCIFLYGDYFILRFYDTQHNMRIINCEIGWGGNGIYCISTTNDAPRNFVIRGNYIHDIGVRRLNQNSDAHAIGTQGLCDALIEHNVCENTGTGISLYAFTHQEMKNNVIRRNIVMDTHMLGGANSRGIETMCDNDSLSDKTGNLFYQNIVMNADMGFRFTHEDEQKVLNNLAYCCGTGIVFPRSYGDHGSRVTLRNNIIYGSVNHHIFYRSGASPDSTLTMIDSDYNLFYPDGPNKFYCSPEEGSFDDWRTFVQRDFVYDPHSMVAEPRFVDPNNADFHLRSDSPCRNTGIDVGLRSDFEGNPIPQEWAVDIGVYEYSHIRQCGQDGSRTALSTLSNSAVRGGCGIHR